MKSEIPIIIKISIKPLIFLFETFFLSLLLRRHRRNPWSTSNPLRLELHFPWTGSLAACSKRISAAAFEAPSLSALARAALSLQFLILIVQRLTLLSQLSLRGADPVKIDIYEGFLYDGARAALSLSLSLPRDFALLRPQTFRVRIYTYLCANVRSHYYITRQYTESCTRRASRDPKEFLPSVFTAPHLREREEGNCVWRSNEEGLPEKGIILYRGRYELRRFNVIAQRGNNF